MPITLVLADDHPLVLDGLDRLFALEPGFSVLARCLDGETTLQAVREHRPDILILDLKMPKKNGLAVLRELRREGIPTRAVILSAAVDNSEVCEAVRLGARGLILKEMAPQKLLQCISKVHAGEQWLERSSTGHAVEDMLRRENAAAESIRVLSAREHEIVQMVARGLRNKEIATNLSITEGTVKIHLHHIYEKLGVDGRVALTLYAQMTGIV